MIIPHKPKPKKRYVTQAARAPERDAPPAEPVFGQTLRSRGTKQRIRRARKAPLHPPER